MGADVRSEPDVAAPRGPIPRYLTLGFDPARPVYRTGAALLPVVEILDLDGQVIPNAGFEITVEPAESAVLNDAGRWQLDT